MSEKPLFSVQVFERRRDDLLQGASMTSACVDEAMARARDVAEMFGGAAVLCRSADGTGQPAATTVLATFGEVPAGFGCIDPGWRSTDVARSAG